MGRSSLLQRHFRTMGGLRTVGEAHDFDISRRVLVPTNISNRRFHRFLDPPKRCTASDLTWRKCHLAAWLCPNSYTAQYSPDSNFNCLDDRSSSASHNDSIKHNITADCDTNLFIRRYGGSDDNYQGRARRWYRGRVLGSHGCFDIHMVLQKEIATNGGGRDG
ncbi:hypothetical protein CaCOL14_003213 [Colletotrichum acutatum]